jgi:quercetin dioxygenase-like cupin family protein
MFAVAGVATVCGAGAAFAAHVPQVDPATVPTGFLAAHNKVEGIRLSSIARAVDRGKADVFIQHVRLAPGEATVWHTHPGGVFVEVVKGSVTYEAEQHGKCRRLTYDAGEGFFDRGFGHVHRAVAGDDGADFYPVYVLPPGSPTHIIPTPAPEECTEQPGGGHDADEDDDHAGKRDDHGDRSDDDHADRSDDHAFR